MFVNGIRNPYTDLVYDADGPQMDIRLVAYEADGVTPRGVITDPLSIEFYDRTGRTPTLSVTWTDKHPAHLALLDARVIAMEVLAAYEDDQDDNRNTWRWREYRNSRFLVDNSSHSNTDVTGARTLTATGAIAAFDGSPVWATDLTDDGQREFKDATPGAIIRTLMTEAQARGELKNFSTGFTATHDSFGQAWSNSPITRSFAPSTTLHTLMNSFAESGIIEFWMDGHTLHMAPTGSWDKQMMADGWRPYIREVMQPDSPESTSYADLISNILVLGDEGFTHTYGIPAAYLPPGLFPTGGRSVVLSAGGVKTVAEAERIAVKHLVQNLEPATTFTRSWTYTGDISATQSMPVRNFSTGDWIFADIEGERRATMQVQEMSLSRDNKGALTAFVSVGTLRDDLLTRLAQAETAANESAKVVSTGPAKPAAYDPYPGKQQGLKLTHKDGGLTAWALDEVGAPYESLRVDRDTGAISMAGDVAVPERGVRLNAGATSLSVEPAGVSIQSSGGAPLTVQNLPEAGTDSSLRPLVVHPQDGTIYYDADGMAGRDLESVELVATELWFTFTDGTVTRVTLPSGGGAEGVEYTDVLDIIQAFHPVTLGRGWNTGAVFTAASTGYSAGDGTPKSGAKYNLIIDTVHEFGVSPTAGTVRLKLIGAGGTPYTFDYQVDDKGHYSGLIAADYLQDFRPSLTSTYSRTYKVIMVNNVDSLPSGAEGVRIELNAVHD